MTRINLIPVEELSDQHLIAEFRELPKCIKQSIDTSNAPQKYCFGKYHIKWAKHHSMFLLHRYQKLYDEMKFRDFKTNYDPSSLASFLEQIPKKDLLEYYPDEEDIRLSWGRIMFRILSKPNWYRWTNREIPKYVQEIRNEI